MGGRRSTGVRAKCPTCGREMAVYEPSGQSPNERERWTAVMRRDPSLTPFHYPAHPSGGPYCKNYASVVKVEDVVSGLEG